MHNSVTTQGLWFLLNCDISLWKISRCLMQKIGFTLPTQVIVFTISNPLRVLLPYQLLCLVAEIKVEQDIHYIYIFSFQKNRSSRNYVILNQHTRIHAHNAMQANDPWTIESGCLGVLPSSPSSHPNSIWIQWEDNDILERNIGRMNQIKWEAVGLTMYIMYSSHSCRIYTFFMLFFLAFFIVIEFLCFQGSDDWHVLQVVCRCEIHAV